MMEPILPAVGMVLIFALLLTLPKKQMLQMAVVVGVGLLAFLAISDATAAIHPNQNPTGAQK